MSGIPFIGSKISLISKSDIRYEGILHAIDTNESTVALENVQIFGTEGRGKPDKQILPNDQIYEYIVFRGSDIKDLHVKEAPIPKAAPIQDPAIVSMPAAKPPTVPAPKVQEPIKPAPIAPAKAAPLATPAPVQQSIAPQKPAPVQAPVTFASVVAPRAPATSAAAAVVVVAPAISKPPMTAAQLVSSFKDLSVEKADGALDNRKPARDYEERDQRSIHKGNQQNQNQSQNPAQTQSQYQNQNRDYRQQRTMGGRPDFQGGRSDFQGGRPNYGYQNNGGGYAHRGRRSQNQTQNQNARDVFVPKSDFDIQSSNAKFDKDKLVEELPEVATTDSDVDKDKKDFRTRTHEESKLNMETFGRTLNPYRGGHHRGGYRGNGRGGGGGYYHHQHRSGYGGNDYQGRGGYSREPIDSVPQ